MNDLVLDLWRRRHELTPAEWQEAAPILLGMLAASGTEAQRATTVKQGVVHDGPVPERQTPIAPCNQTTP